MASPSARRRWSTAFDEDHGCGQAGCVAEWVYFLHPPRDDFAATLADQEQEAFVAHAEWLRRLLADGALIVAGPTLRRVNTGIAIFEAPDEETARRIVAEEPVTRDGFARGELRPFRMGFLRGRD
jgi:uncharacterized protein YciI